MIPRTSVLDSTSPEWIAARGELLKHVATPSAAVPVQARERSAPAALAPVAIQAPQRAPARPSAPVVLVTPKPPRHAYAPIPSLQPSTPRVEYADPFLEAHRAKLEVAGPRRIPFDEARWDFSDRSAVALDVETFVNFFVVCVERVSTGQRMAFERSARSDIDADLLGRVLRGGPVVTFNGSAYDLPMVALALTGADNPKLKVASDRIVKGNLRPWDVERELGVRVPRIRHVDLMEPCPAVHQSLKMIHGRLHGRYMVDLPFAEDAALTPEQMNVTTLYCFNDLDATRGLYGAMREPLQMRADLGSEHGENFLSRSDAQIGEAIVRKKVETTTGQRARRGADVAPTSFGYDVPEFVRFDGTEMRRVVGDLRAARFAAASGDITPPEFLRDLKVKVGEMSYSMGIGGLHSTEAHRAVVADDERALLDVDVASQYPNIIMKLGIYPEGLGPGFLDVYGMLIRERMEARDRGDKTRADGIKISLNGCFGKFGSHYSPLYAPNLLVAVTLTGQLAVLMLIERAEAAGVRVVSANTDGVVFYFDRSRRGDLDAILAKWEEDAGFTTQRTPYRALYSSSVNTYVAVREDGKVKAKGPPADPWSEGDLRGQMMKNPQMTICSEAVTKYLTTGAPLEDTVYRATDPRKFVTVIRVASGGLWRGHRLGRAVRYYWSTDGEPIGYADGSRKVAKTDGARPMPYLPDSLPPDVDRARYVREAEKIAADLAVPGFAASARWALLAP